MEDIEQAMQIMQLRLLAAGTIARPLLIDVVKVISMWNKVAAFYSSAEGYKCIIAATQILHSPVQKPIATVCPHFSTTLLSQPSYSQIETMQKQD